MLHSRNNTPFRNDYAVAAENKTTTLILRVFHFYRSEQLISVRTTKVQ